VFQRFISSYVLTNVSRRLASFYRLLFSCVCVVSVQFTATKKQYSKVVKRNLYTTINVYQVRQNLSGSVHKKYKLKKKIHDDWQQQQQRSKPVKEEEEKVVEEKERRRRIKPVVSAYSCLCRRFVRSFVLRACVLVVHIL